MCLRLTIIYSSFSPIILYFTEEKFISNFLWNTVSQLIIIGNSLGLLGANKHGYSYHIQDSACNYLNIRSPYQFDYEAI